MGKKSNCFDFLPELRSADRLSGHLKEILQYISLYARVAELVYAHDLKSCLARDVGSTPTSGTKICQINITQL